VGLTTTGPLEAFAADVGPPDAGPVTCVGGRTQWAIGGVAHQAREVRAPAGVVTLDPAEMTVRVRAATEVADVDGALEEHRQVIALPAWPGATVGGVLAVGHSGIRRLGYGPVRDTLLEARVVSADGRLVKAGGPTVKNVSGYDLCRLLVGSLGTLGLIGEVLLRTRPRPEVTCWLAGVTDPFALRHRLHRPVAVLWDGETTWVCLEGHAADVASQVRVAGLPEVPGPPPVPPFRWSMPPKAIRGLERRADGRDPSTSTGSIAGGLRDFRPPPPDPFTGWVPGPFLAEVGVGVVHVDRPVPAATPSTEVAELGRRVKTAFDPTGRLNPGRQPGAASSMGGAT